jgi:hypothetical protein
MLTHLAATLLALTWPAETSADSSKTVRVNVDTARSEVVVTVGPLHVPAGTPYSHHTPETRLQFRWPVSGWVRGYRIDLIDSAGNILPREMLHHAGVANLDRRQLPYPKVERLFAVGRETTPVVLPNSMGVPLDSNQRMALYFGVVNTTNRAIEGASLRLSMVWTANDGARPRDVFVLFLDANPGFGSSSAFDIPPGRSITTGEFTLPISGRVRALGGHLHDHAVEVRLEDVESGAVLAQLRAKRDADGRIRSVSRARFILTRGGLRLHANRRYRVVAVYENLTSATIPNGGMAFMAGPFAPDNAQRWPLIDPSDSNYQRDLASITELEQHAGGHGVYRGPNRSSP